MVIQDGFTKVVKSRLFNLQPSELIKFSLVLVLARYFHNEKDLNFWNNCKNFNIH